MDPTKLHKQNWTHVGTCLTPNSYSPPNPLRLILTVFPIQPLPTSKFQQLIENSIFQTNTIKVTTKNTILPQQFVYVTSYEW